MKLERVFEIVRDDLKAVRAILKAELADIIDSVSDTICDRFIGVAVRHLFDKPGKGLRPALVVFSARLVPGFSTQTLPAIHRLAAVVELIHTASLVHDDIIDEAGHRRRIISEHGKYGVKIAVLVGDMLFTHAFVMLTSLPDVSESLRLSLFAEYAHITRQMCYAEILEQRAVNSAGGVGETDYMRILEWKTAGLMSACCKTAVQLCGGAIETVQALQEYGLNFGYAYQLIDDYQDKDAVIATDIDLRSKAREYLESAERVLASFTSDVYRAGLERLVRFVLERK